VGKHNAAVISPASDQIVILRAVDARTFITGGSTDYLVVTIP